MLRAGALVLLVAAVVLSGCASKAPSPAAPPTSMSSPGAAGPMAGMTHNLTVLHNALPNYLSTAVWANGTVAAQDTCNTGACINDASRAMHITDLTSALPVGVPVHVSVKLDFQPNPIGLGGFDVQLNASESNFYSYDKTNDFSGHVTLDTLLRPSGTVHLVMWAYGPGGNAPSTAYTLSAAIEASPEYVPPGVPMAVHLGGGDSVVVSSAQDKPGSFLLYAPDDHLVGVYQHNVTLPKTAPTGAYALMLPSGAPWANFTTDGMDHNMSALGLAVAIGPTAELPPHGSIDQAYDVQGVPLGVGAIAFPKQSGTGLDPLASNGFTLSMKGPDSFTLQDSSFCNFCLTFGYGAGIQSQLGDERIIAGTYTVHAETTATYDLVVQPFAIFLKR